jgi:hypothetical protein
MQCSMFFLFGKKISKTKSRVFKNLKKKKILADQVNLQIVFFEFSNLKSIKRIEISILIY